MYAAAVLYRMSEDKGGEYSKRLSVELKIAYLSIHKQLVWAGLLESLSESRKDKT